MQAALHGLILVFDCQHMTFSLLTLVLESRTLTEQTNDSSSRQPVATMLQYRLYGGNSLPTNLEGLMKAGANIGSVIGQFAFGMVLPVTCSVLESNPMLKAMLLTHSAVKQFVRIFLLSMCKPCPDRHPSPRWERAYAYHPRHNPHADDADGLTQPRSLPYLPFHVPYPPWHRCRWGLPHVRLCHIGPF